MYLVIAENIGYKMDVRTNVAFSRQKVSGLGVQTFRDLGNVAQKPVIGFKQGLKMAII